MDVKRASIAKPAKRVNRDWAGFDAYVFRAAKG